MFAVGVHTCDFLEVTTKEKIRPDTKAPGLEEARRKLIYYNMDRAEQLAYDEHIRSCIYFSLAWILSEYSVATCSL
ncbi:hypothetical protein [Bacteroides intestinalis]|uniref:hypothetical protein n=1 Tax=Bacteroides intestinalis TaxID=329854 RepID=UPI00189DDFE3|nr:hypothetical protein [Bacteroides intestinalis]